MRQLPGLLPAALLFASAASSQAPVPSPAGFVLEGTSAQGNLVRGVAPAGTIALTLDGEPVSLARDRRFLIGLDRDRQGSAALIAQLADGRIVRRDLAVASRAWRIERINAARRPGGPTAAYLKLRAGELARIAAARAGGTQSEGWRQSFIWPARGRISGVFGSQRIYQGEPGAYHSGVDVAAGAGAPVVAPADGIVVLAGPPAFSLEGNLVILDHGMGLSSAFLHLARSDVRIGERVRQGQPIGIVGATGRATGPHLHWGMKWRDARIDPQRLVGGMRQEPSVLMEKRR